jgi:SET domain-containing protein
MFIAKAGAKGHGVFAAEILKSGEYLAIYTGIRTLKNDSQEDQDDQDIIDTDYQWSYSSMPMDIYGQEQRFDTDALVAGNMMRFVNDSPGGGQNLRVVEIPFKNRWHRLYLVGDRDIQVGEELTVSYGENYWRTRSFV